MFLSLQVFHRNISKNVTISIHSFKQVFLSPCDMPGMHLDPGASTNNKTKTVCKTG